ncbi:hypothetical protein RHSIM_Rhsim12G0128000 [Rhododendron simsii]|uniref:Leucine-rich repeat-containing N-terminal plant-type domain-containing protein n=1 Tax=Rhododendron simsii TaxID=118357 RepID=A0A834G2M0_RHOSS|nr:hypothetical protein RHSIM_Rhsim12G0128000 [Rhododendron simsii]
MGFNLLWFLVVLTIWKTGDEKRSICVEGNPNDLKGLTGFKAEIQSDTSGRIAKWVGQSCCKWDGISCENTTDRVTEINLPGFITCESVMMLLCRLLWKIVPSFNNPPHIS